MKLSDLPTPCLVLDRVKLSRNIKTMADALARHGVPLRPHMKTAKSIDVARLATETLAAPPGSRITQAEAREVRFANGGGI